MGDGLMKYIVLSDGSHEYAVLFDPKLAHIDVAHGIAGESAFSKWSKVMGRLEAVSAGFVTLPECTVDRARGSESLRLKPRPQDGALMRGEQVPVAALPTTAPIRPKRSMLERAKGARGR